LSAFVVVLLVAGAFVFYRIWWVYPMGPGPDTGELAPDFSLTDQHGQPAVLSEMLSDGPVIVVFYRGYW
jgi:hypothetical protein